MPGSYPTDENLRLIFAEGHETWLQDQLRSTKRLAVRFAIVAIIGLGWIGGVALFITENANKAPNCVSLESGATLAQLIEQGAVPAGTTVCSDDQLSTPTRQSEEGLSSTNTLILSATMLIALTIVLAFGVETVRSGYRIKKFRAYIRDHGDFLDKYNRT